MGLKASRTVIRMIVRVACPLAREVPAGMGQTVLPYSQPLQGISTHSKLNPSTKAQGLNAVTRGRRTPVGACRDLVPFETWGPAKEDSLSTSLLALSKNTA